MLRLLAEVDDFMIFMILSWLFFLVAFVCAIMLLIDAFKNQVWKGILGFFCGLYLIYYGFTECSLEKKMLITGGYIAGMVLGYALMAMGAAQVVATTPVTPGT